MLLRAATSFCLASSLANAAKKFLALISFSFTDLAKLGSSTSVSAVLVIFVLLSGIKAATFDKFTFVAAVKKIFPSFFFFSEDGGLSAHVTSDARERERRKRRGVENLKLKERCIFGAFYVNLSGFAVVAG